MVISIWSGSPDDPVAAARVVEAFEIAQGLDASQSIAVFILISASARPELPNSVVRSSIARAYRPWRHRIAAQAIVYEGEDWLAGLLRTLVIQLDRLVKPPFANRTFGTRGEAAAWLSRTIAPTLRLGTAEILDAIRIAETGSIP
ncbi:MAG: hypothetical protein R3A78_12735 [Polyangiales bacterium]|nr:hypothetical protein [Myxococcales bacterium]